MHVLFGYVGVVPDDVLLESAGGGIVLDLDDLSPHDAFESVQDGARTEPFQRVRPLGSIAQTHRIVIPVRVPKPQHEASSGLQPQGIDQLLAQQTHGGRAEDDDPLLVQPDDALIRAKVENLGGDPSAPSRSSPEAAAFSCQAVGFIVLTANSKCIAPHNGPRFADGIAHLRTNTARNPLRLSPRSLWFASH